MTAHERANTRAVDARHAAQVDHELVVAVSKELLNLAFERLGGTAGQQRFVRRQHEPGRYYAPSTRTWQTFPQYLRADPLAPELQGV